MADSRRVTDPLAPRGVLAAPSAGGLAAGLLFWLASTTPTLIPRPWLFQALISGFALAIGYGIGVLGARLAGRLLGRGRPWPSDVARGRALALMLVAWALGVFA